MMMLASLVVRSGCGTPLWLTGGKGGGVVVGGLVVVYWVMDSDRNVLKRGRGSPDMVIRLVALAINEQ